MHTEPFTEDSLEALPAVLSMPGSGLLLQLFDAGLVVPNGLDLNAEHYEGEDGEQ